MIQNGSILEEGGQFIIGFMRSSWWLHEVIMVESGAAINGRDQHGWTALHRASFKGRIDAVCVLLEKGIDVDAKDEDGYTALHCAVESGDGVVVKVLVKKGADVGTRTKKGVTAFKIAESLHNVGIMRILINAGASRDNMDQISQTLLNQHLFRLG